MASSDSWIVEGVATYEYGGSILKEFEFHCTSKSNNGNGLSWAKKDVSLSRSQTILKNGISLHFNNPDPDANDAGIYICSDANSNDDDAVLNITAGKLLPFTLYYIN